MYRNLKTVILVLPALAVLAVLAAAGGNALAAEQGQTYKMAATKVAECTLICRRWAVIRGKAYCVGGWQKVCTGGGGVRG